MESPVSIEVTDAMLDSVDGATVSENDVSPYRRRVYAQIFSNMLMASADPRLKDIRQVSLRGAPIGERPADPETQCSTSRKADSGASG